MNLLPDFDRPPRIAAVGLASWDRLLGVEAYPTEGGYAIVRRDLSAPGGTTSNSAIAASRLGAEVKLAALVGDDGYGAELRSALEREGVDCGWLTTVEDRPTDYTTIVVSPPAERTIFWHKGARLVRGDRLDISGIFGHDIVLLDVDDAPLRRFLTDLPAHTTPTTRLLGTMTYFEPESEPDAFIVAMRHDILVGNEREAMLLTGTSSLDEALARFQGAMLGNNLRTVVVTRGRLGAIAASRDERWEVPGYDVDAVDTTGAGDAFAGALACAAATRWPWPVALAFGNAVAALSTTGFGAQTTLPTLAEVRAFLAAHP